MHRKIEGYVIPRQFVGTATATFPCVPKKLFPVFRDREELPVSSRLSDNIRAALEQSRFLIVICSPDAEQSQWVNEEVRIFKQLKGADTVLPVIISGEPNAGMRKTDGSQQECFPEALRFAVDESGVLTNQPVEPVSADARETGDGRRRAVVKIIAGMLGIDFNALWQREKRRRRRNTILLATALTVASLTVFSSIQWRRAERGKQEERKARQLAQHNLSNACIQSSRLERNNLRYIPARRYAFKALQAEASIASRLAVWEMLARTPIVLKRFFLSANNSNAAVLLPDGRIAYTGDNALVIIDTSGNEIGSIPQPLDNSNIATLVYGTPIVAVRSYSGAVSLFNTEKMKTLPWFRPHSKSPGIASCNPCLLAVSNSEGVADIYNYAAGNPPHRIDRIEGINDKIIGISFSGNGHLLGILGDEEIAVYDRHKHHRLWSSSANGTYNGIAFSPTGDRVAFGEKDGTITIADAASGDHLLSIPTRCRMSSFKFSPDGEHLSIAGVWGAGVQRRPSWVEYDTYSGIPTLVFESPESFSSFTYVDDDRIMLFSGGIATLLQRPELWHRGRHDGVIRGITLCSADRSFHVLRRCNSDTTGYSRAIFHPLSQLSGNHLTEFTRYLTCHSSFEHTTNNLRVQSEWTAKDATTFTAMDSNRLLVGMKNGDIRLLNTRLDSISDPLLSLHNMPTFLYVNNDSLVLIGVHEEKGHDLHSGLYLFSDSSLAPALLPLEAGLGASLNATAGAISATGTKAVMAFSPYLLPGIESRTRIVHFDITDKKVSRAIDLTGGMVRAIHPLSDSTLFIIGNAAGTITFYNSATKKFEASIQAGTLPVFSLTTVAIDGKEIIAAGDGGGTVRFINPVTREVLYETDPCGEPVCTILPDQQNNRVIIGAGRQVWSWKFTLNTDTLLHLINAAPLEYDEERQQRAQEFEQKGDLKKAARLYEKLTGGSKVKQSAFLNEALSVYWNAGMYSDAFRILEKSRAAELAYLKKKNTHLYHKVQFNTLRSTYHGNQSSLNSIAWRKTGDTTYLKNAITSFINSLYFNFDEPDENLASTIAEHQFLQSHFADAGDYITSQHSSTALLYFLRNHTPSTRQDSLLFYISAVFNRFLSTLVPGNDVDGDSLMTRWSAGLSLSKESKYCQELLLGTDTINPKIADFDTAYHARIYYLRGVNALREGKPAIAGRSFRKGRESGDYFNMCRFQLDRMSGKNTATLINTDTLKTQYQPLIGYLRCRTLNDAGDTAGALREIRAACDRARAIDRPFPQGWYWKNVLFRKMNLTDSADAALKEATNRDTLFIWSFWDKSEYHLKRNEWEPARCALEVFFEETSESGVEIPTSSLAEKYGQRGFISLMCGRFEDAVRFSREGLDLDPTQVWIATNLAHGLLLSGRKVEADRIYTHYKDTLVSNGKISFSNAVLNDFKLMRETGIDSPEFTRIETLYGYKPPASKIN
ncbi:MAG: toll/interleukin-1 receptor domain-containing protein [Chitinispirillaceae bacterium]|nr:toll/interleukin-1 receptor domain-containing protein [Chitinispirillaceae bacterium]